MHYNLKGTGLSLSPEMREYVERRLGRLEELLRDPEDARFDIELEYGQSEGKQYRAECMLHDPKLHTTFRAEAFGGTLHEAVDRLEDELFQEFTKTKVKRLHRIRRGALRAKNLLRGLGRRKK